MINTLLPCHCDIATCKEMFNIYYAVFFGQLTILKAKLVKETETVLYEGWTPGNYKSIKNIKGVIMRFSFPT